MRVNILNFQHKLRLNRARIKTAVLNTLAAEKANTNGQITVCLMDDKTIRKLNKRHMHKDEPTDVLAFSLGHKGKDNLLADIAVSTERAFSNARAFRTSAAYETYLYIIHGTLHALGYNDKKEKERKAMTHKASGVLKNMNLRHAHT